MSIDLRSTKRPVRPNFPQPSRAQKAAMAFVAVLVSSTLLGGMLRMFEMRSGEAAMARAPAQSAPSTDRVALREVVSASRG